MTQHDKLHPTTKSEDITMERAKESARTMTQRGNDYIDEASTSVGRAMQSGADGLASGAMSVSRRVNRAGRYLESSRPEDMGRDIRGFVSEHPTVTLAIGFGFGLLLGRALSR